ncbi:hypothetical protein [Nocardia brasiliensis]|uniref:hypothetical protein n=1 Tax=Nocardia brasiliensis TaxID=37326 RepID=UPI0004A7874F|nr:hypothetical protein [Nocardia brasiliensis]MBF6124189.1 hypothetical protein [Nocardia brasiliensis]MBF6544001.1 hypothetical protein [Nocardia brasiliensis]
MKVWRGLSGLVAAGTFALMLVVVGTAVIAARRDFPGPGAESVTWHVAAAVIALAAQIYSDKRRGLAAFSGSAVVFVAAGLLLWTQWWS